MEADVLFGCKEHDVSRFVALWCACPPGIMQARRLQNHRDTYSEVRNANFDEEAELATLTSIAHFDQNHDLCVLPGSREFEVFFTY